MAKFTVQNDGPEIVTSDYWASSLAREGHVYLTPNAGVWRLLVPEGWRHLADAKAAAGVCITRGSLYGRDAVEILFDDGSQNPLALHTTTQAVERLPADDDGHKLRTITVWGDGPEKLLELPCYYRLRPSLPCLEDWKKP